MHRQYQTQPMVIQLISCQTNQTLAGCATYSSGYRIEGGYPGNEKDLKWTREKGDGNTTYDTYNKCTSFVGWGAS